MYPILILRSEAVCLIILTFLLFTSRVYNINRDSKVFNRMLVFAFLHVLFDIITVLTVNNTETVPDAVNRICHIIFYLTAILFSNELANYVFSLCCPQLARKFYCAGHSVIALYLCALPFLDIDYAVDLGTKASTGPAAYVGYGIAFLFFISSLLIILGNLDKMPGSIKSALIPMLIVLIIIELCQIKWRSLLFTGGAITVATVGFFFSLENPVLVFRKKAMTDALTGVRSRSSYESDLKKLDDKFRSKPDDKYIFVFCDIDGLRTVNNRFGHAEGDNYITLIASAIGKCMKHSSCVYRIGGDEFIILYEGIDTETVEAELSALRDSCVEISEDLEYKASVSTGYARSSAEYASLNDVIKTADYIMYRNKSKTKAETDSIPDFQGAKINYAGLTNKIFDAMCSSNDRSYPYLMNLDTNVARISPSWNEYFGMGGEFFTDFYDVWRERIHPDDVDGYTADITATLTGRQKYHNYDYYAKRADGKYVRVSCHGSLYQNADDSTSYFSGFIVNHGLDGSTDPVTGLRNFEELSSDLLTIMENGSAYTVIKLKLNSFSRINMLYGYSGGDVILNRVAEILSELTGDAGEVFCQDGVRFSILFRDNNKNKIEALYRSISSRLAAGVDTAKGTVPILIAGGAVTGAGKLYSIQDVRRGLVYALEESVYYRRNKLVFHDALNTTALQADISLLTAIHDDALADLDFFRLRYQPIIDMQSRKIIGAEALLRWIHPDYGEVSPNKFIAFLENDPCYYRLGLKIIDAAVRDSVEFCRIIPDFKINVNITALQLEVDSFANDVLAVLDKYAFPPDRLVLELTERCKEMDSSFLAGRIEALRNAGIHVAFDDLGTGYSSVQLLMDIPIDEIKLDRDFVRDLQNKSSYTLYVEALVLGAASSGYTICFEGIEDENMLDYVEKFGSYLAQGYFFSKPLLKDEFHNYISRTEAEPACDDGLN